MCYLVTGINTSQINTGRYFAIFDTEEDAKVEAEKLAQAGHNEVVVWKKVAAPKVEKKVVWE